MRRFSAIRGDRSWARCCEEKGDPQMAGQKILDNDLVSINTKLNGPLT